MERRDTEPPRSSVSPGGEWAHFSLETGVCPEVTEDPAGFTSWSSRPEPGGENEAASAAASIPQPHFRVSLSFLGFRTCSSKERSGKEGYRVLTVAAAGVGKNCLEEKWRRVGCPWRNGNLRGEAERFRFWVPARGRELRRE